MTRIGVGSPPTDRQAQILGFIIAHIEDNGAPPTLREISAEFSLGSTNAAMDHLRALKRRGLIDFGERLKSRFIRIPNVRWQMVSLATREARP